MPGTSLVPGIVKKDFIFFLFFKKDFKVCDNLILPTTQGSGWEVSELAHSSPATN